MTRFVIDLGDVPLSKEASAALNADLQKVALTHIAGLQLDKPWVVRFPRDWWGFILRKDFEAMLEGQKALERGILQSAGRM